MKLFAFALVGALALPTVAAAQTCASPLPIRSNTSYPNPTSTTATTCGGQAGLNLGGTIYPHPSIVYSFVAQSANATLTLTGTDREMSLVNNCANAPIAIGFVGGPMVVNGLTNGTTYYVVVSTDPSIPTPPIQCGAYTLTVAGTLPVSLQDFSVE